MKILVLGMNYIPEKTAIGPLTADMCQNLVARGHMIYMITGFPHFPEWHIYKGYKCKLFSHEILNDVKIRRGFVYVPGKPNPLHRVMYDTSISISAGINLIGLSRPKVIIVISPPLQLVVLALAAGKIWNVPVLLVIKDIVPDVAISLGMLKNQRVIRSAKKLELFCYLHADHISVIGQGFMENLLSKQVPKKKISIIPDWTDTDLIYPMDRMSRFRKKHNISPDTFVVLYGGNMSFKQGLDNVILAAEQIQDLTNVQFVLIGQGAARESLFKLAKQLNLSNVSFLPFEPEEMFPDMLAAADVLLLNQRANVSDSVLPCKFLNYMAAGCPVVAAVNGESETATYLKKACCGRRVPPEQPSALAKEVRRLYEDKALRIRLGENGRRFAEENFGRNKVLNLYSNLIERLGRSRTTQRVLGQI